MFTNDAESPRKETGFVAGSPMHRAPSSLSGLSTEGAAVLKKDSNWDFAEVDRPPIYMVDVRAPGARDGNRRST